FVFGASFIMPAMSTASLSAFPHMAGAASALTGFLQIGGGLAGGVLAVLIGDPVIALATVIPVMGLLSIISWLIWARIPPPVRARVMPIETTPRPQPAAYAPSSPGAWEQCLSAVHRRGRRSRFRPDGFRTSDRMQAGSPDARPPSLSPDEC